MTEVCTVETGTDGCARLAGPLTFESVPALYREAEKLFQGDNSVSSIDLTGVSEADSAGLALLLEWQASQKLVSKDLEITNAPASLMSLASLCEADELMNFSGRSTIAVRNSRSGWLALSAGATSVSGWLRQPAGHHDRPGTRSLGGLQPKDSLIQHGFRQSHFPPGGQRLRRHHA